MTFQPTRALLQDEALSTLVDALAHYDRIESSHVGFAGAPSEVYAAFQKVQERASREELLSLLRHESPVVRGYIVQHIISKTPEDIPHLSSLIEDQSPVNTLDGCMGGATTIASSLVELMRYEPYFQDPQKKSVFRREAGAFLVKVARAHVAISSNALFCCAAWTPTEATEIAEAWLREPGASTEAKLSAIRTLGKTGLSTDALLAPTKDPDPTLRREAASALWKRTDEPALLALKALKQDPEPGVALAAEEAQLRQTYLRYSQESIEQIEELFDYIRTGASAAAERVRSLCKKDTPEALALLELYGLSYQPHNDIFMALRDGPRTALVTEMVRRLAKKLAPRGFFQGDGARVGVMAYLAELRDPKDLPEMRRSLQSKNSGELEYALKTIVALKDRASIPLLEEIASQQGDFASQAKAALSALR